MIACTRHTHETTGRPARRWLACVCAAALLALVGCKSDKPEMLPGTGVARGKDPLVYGPTKIPRQDLPIPDRATGPNGKRDPLTTPTGNKTGYSDDPERFKGTFIPGKSSTPAALAGRNKDDDGLRIDSPGVPLTPAGGVLPGGALEAPEGVSPLYTQLDKYGVKPEDRSLEREDGKYVFRASVPISGNGARRQYTGVGTTAPEAVRQVIDQVASDRK
jgi:hypothetical protein